MDMVASKDFRFRNRQMLAGQTFAARKKAARVLKALFRADYAPTYSRRDMVAASPEVSELQALRQAYEAKIGKRPDKRWGMARLKKELE